MHWVIDYLNYAKHKKQVISNGNQRVCLPPIKIFSVQEGSGSFLSFFVTEIELQHLCIAIVA